MKIPLILVNIFFLHAVLAYDSESPEVNKIEVSPIYDTIVFSDIADIINDFDTNINPAFDPFPSSDSESEENIDDLLAEYQHYLDKAHKQRKNYMEKTKIKNKVPLVRHERYSKTKPSMSGAYDDFYPNAYYNTNDFKVPQIPYNSPFDLFIPFNTKARYFNKPDYMTTPSKGNHEEETYEKLMHRQKLADLPPDLPKAISQPIKSSCYCKDSKLPCECDCKQCLISLDPTPRNNIDVARMMPIDEEKKGLANDPFMLDYSIKNPDEKSGDNALNIRIKVDIQLPKMQENVGKSYKMPNREGKLEPEEGNSKEFMSTIHLPTSYYNFPLPMELLGFPKTAKYSKHDSSPLHKVTIHKKKKTKTNNNKKHRKKVITFHNIKLEPHRVYPVPLEVKHNNTQNVTQPSIAPNKTVEATAIQPNVTIIHGNNFTTIQSNDTVNKIQTEESIYLTLNISNNDNLTDDFHKMENSIETEYKNVALNVSTIKPKLRSKREIKSLANIAVLVNDSLSQVKNILNITKSLKDKNNTNKPDKPQLLDAELLFWPNSTVNESQATSKNLTTILLEREVKKTKLNMSRDTLLRNHTRALEQAIFGDVDWNDIESVAPAFMSFVGKYLRGMLTFCNQSVCHSMKCADKACVHRTCLADNRLNKRGHCAGSNGTDSVASMESIMDLPSNIAFEIVDILQDRMLGKLFGKVTLCMSSKCISFVASRKVFQKTKCSSKELTSAGHCPNLKNVKKF